MVSLDPNIKQPPQQTTSTNTTSTPTKIVDPNPWNRDTSSNYDWTTMEGLPTNVTPFESFDFDAYVQQNPWVMNDAGFTGAGQYDPEGENPNPTIRDALYSHYLQRFPDRPSVALPDANINFQPGQYQQRAAAVANYIDPATGSIRADLLGGQYTDPNNIPIEVLAERQALIDQGFDSRGGDLWGTGAAGEFTTGFEKGSVDKYGRLTPRGYMEDEYLNPSLKPGTEFVPEMMQVQEGELLDPNAYRLSPTGAQAAQREAQYTAADAVDKTDAASYNPATVEITPEATVQGQLNELMQQFEGGNVPPWAAPNIRNARQMLASRGMGASSIAGAALIQASLEAATPIAAADAAKYEKALFTNASYQNAARQFNAQSKQQNDQFFASLYTQNRQFNADQKNALERFNAGEANALNQFNARMQDMRERFNVQNRMVIDQSNAEWRRRINTTNTAAQNAANQFNAANLLAISNTAMNNLWQEWRDKADYAFTATENQKARDHQLAVMTLQNEEWFRRLSAQQQAATSASIGNLIGGVLTADSDSIVGDLFGGLFGGDDDDDFSISFDTLTDVNDDLTTAFDSNPDIF